MVDRRIRRTRHALIEAFDAIVLSGRRGRIGVLEVVKRAGVGRSTFYDHYSGAEALHLDALKRPLSILADAAAGVPDPAKLTRLLEHFWEFRQRARDSFNSATERMLSEMVRERLADIPLAIPHTIAARQLAASALTPVTAWIRAEAWCPAPELAEAICRSCRAQLDALTPP